MESVELFAGAGGLGMGISKAGFKTVSVIEKNTFCCDTIRQNQDRRVEPVVHWPISPIGDVREVDFKQYKGRLALVSGGPPCQPFSVGGKHRAHEDSRDMWPQAVRAIREARPQAFIFENVKGLTRVTFATYLSYIQLQLTYPDVIKKDRETWLEHRARLEKTHSSSPHSGLIYNVIPRVLNAANYGIPQRRERIFFVGFRSDESAAWSFPPETHSLDSLLWEQCNTKAYWDRLKVAKRSRVVSARFEQRARTLVERPTLAPWRTVRDAIGNLPDPEIYPAKAAAFSNHLFQPGARTYQGHTGSPLDEPAKTLKAGVHGVPGGENMLVRADGSSRYFTVRESARLQTFPDDYAFHGSWSEAMRQLGNAVPVDLAQIVAKSVLAKLQAKVKAVA
jgi:DNA (cytosine-5)-methyltransferase 1